VNVSAPSWWHRLIFRGVTVTRAAKFRPILAIFTFVFGVYITPAHAVIIDNGMTTIDTASGLEWLDLTETVNRSYADVASQFGVGGELEGWRHATTSELNTLAANAGFPTPYDLQPVTTAFTDLIDMLGRTHDGTGVGGNPLVGIGAVGWFDDGASPTGTSHWRFFELDTGATIIAQILATTIDSTATTFTDVDTGNWLVRAAVSEPTVFLQFGFALLLIARLRLKSVG